MDHEHRSDRFTAVEEQYAGYTVVDESGSKIGKVDDLFLDENDQPEYFGVKMGFLGTSSTLIPADITTINNEQGFIELSQTKSTVQDGPAFDDDREITPEYENEVRSYYGLGPVESSGFYGDYEETNGHSGAGTTDSTTAGTVGSGMSMGDTETGEFREHDRNQEGLSQPGSDLEDEDELRVQRSEEELVAGTREREAGAMKVRKRVRTDRERIEVPTTHEEVSVEPVPMSGEATEAQIGED
jgi:stress response protein YsnF